MMHESVIFAGFGGQGVMFVGQLLAYAAMDAGLEVTWIPSYGPEMRGGTANCTVVISDKLIGSPIVRHPSCAVVFNNPSFDKYEAQVASGGVLVVNSSLVTHIPTRTEIQTLMIPATQLAEQVGDPKLTNVVLLGALLQAEPIIPLETVISSLPHHIPVHRRHLIDANIEALRIGAEQVIAVP